MTVNGVFLTLFFFLHFKCVTGGSFKVIIPNRLLDVVASCVCASRKANTLMVTFSKIKPRWLTSWLPSSASSALRVRYRPASRLGFSPGTQLCSRYPCCCLGAVVWVGRILTAWDVDSNRPPGPLVASWVSCASPASFVSLWTGGKNDTCLVSHFENKINQARSVKHLA